MHYSRWKGHSDWTRWRSCLSPLCLSISSSQRLSSIEKNWKVEQCLCQAGAPPPPVVTVQQTAPIPGSDNYNHSPPHWGSHRYGIDTLTSFWAGSMYLCFKIQTWNSVLGLNAHFCRGYRGNNFLLTLSLASAGSFFHVTGPPKPLLFGALGSGALTSSRSKQSQPSATVKIEDLCTEHQREEESAKCLESEG